MKLKFYSSSYLLVRKSSVDPALLNFFPETRTFSRIRAFCPDRIEQSFQDALDYPRSLRYTHYITKSNNVMSAFISAGSRIAPARVSSKATSRRLINHPLRETTTEENPRAPLLRGLISARSWRPKLYPIRGQPFGEKPPLSAWHTLQRRLDHKKAALRSADYV